MRTTLLAAAGAAIVSPALAAKSPVPVSYGSNKVLKFTLDKNHDLTSGTVHEEDAGLLPSFAPGHPHFKMPVPNLDLHKPPVFNHEGNCCRPTGQCHAYFKWVIDMLNGNRWDGDDQKRDAMAHLECCMRQFNASCADPPKSDTLRWHDPKLGCSNGGPEPAHEPEAKADADDDAVEADGGRPADESKLDDESETSGLGPIGPLMSPTAIPPKETDNAAAEAVADAKANLDKAAEELRVAEEKAKGAGDAAPPEQEEQGE
ncbi:uncharacterized protein HMPREF1541_06564 [Cyphellophora europaea CBS 101466]|uniref:Uncharacterized protein n=1 Tax=Cyphellophora europaea (strain CBS 101466) TaxID=1220924 RepID=W2RS42_CYPE1|nr:uncharacterized protein HMPREF1541_06564 [Cyphellophora europaea CBS 101466]ETN38529.1 hypothetical protein HMPREF1541_06564 [Cyphellophora europaea CBS 101466]